MPSEYLTIRSIYTFMYCTFLCTIKFSCVMCVYVIINFLIELNQRVLRDVTLHGN